MFVRDTFRTDHSFARHRNAGLLSDAPSKATFEHNEPLFLFRMEVRPHPVVMRLGQQLSPKYFAVGRVASREKGECLAGLRALDRGADWVHSCSGLRFDLLRGMTVWLAETSIGYA